MIYKKFWKYILVRDDSVGCKTLKYYRPKAIKNFSDVSKDDLGGYIKGYHNLSQFGDCWVYDYAKVKDRAQVSENAKVYDSAWVTDSAKVFGNARLYNNVKVLGNALVKNSTRIYGNLVIDS